MPTPLFAAVDGLHMFYISGALRDGQVWGGGHDYAQLLPLGLEHVQLRCWQSDYAQVNSGLFPALFSVPWSD